MIKQKSRLPRSLYRILVLLIHILPGSPLAVLLVCFTCRCLAHCPACWIPCLFYPPTSCPPRCLLNHSFPFVDEPNDESLVSSCLHLACLAACYITCFFYLPTSCPHRRLLDCFFALLVDVLTAALLAGSLVCFTRRCLARRAPCRITPFLLLTSCLPRRTMNRTFLFVYVLPASPLATSLVSFTCRRVARIAACRIACLFYSSMSCPQHHLLYCLFHSGVTPKSSRPGTLPVQQTDDTQ
jgi:hypothetical protein